MTNGCQPPPRPDLPSTLASLSRLLVFSCLSVPSRRRHYQPAVTSSSRRAPSAADELLKLPTSSLPYQRAPLLFHQRSGRRTTSWPPQQPHCLLPSFDDDFPPLRMTLRPRQPLYRPNDDLPSLPNDLLPLDELSAPRTASLTSQATSRHPDDFIAPPTTFKRFRRLPPTPTDSLCALSTIIWPSFCQEVSSLIDDPSEPPTTSLRLRQCLHTL